MSKYIKCYHFCSKFYIKVYFNYYLIVHTSLHLFYKRSLHKANLLLNVFSNQTPKIFFRRKRHYANIL